MLKEMIVAGVCAILVLEGMSALQLYGLDAASGALAGAAVGGLGIAFVRLRRKMTHPQRTRRTSRRR